MDSFVRALACWAALWCGIFVVAATQASCSPATLAKAAVAFGKVAQGSQYLGTLIDVADTGSKLYFDRHPNLQAEREVRQRLQQARLAQQALDASLAAAQGAADGDVQTARTEALRAYTALRELLQSLGIPQAIPPAGGAETDAPEPRPFDMPPPEAVEAALQA
jgi:hypothetical protein